VKVRWPPELLATLFPETPAVVVAMYIGQAKAELAELQATIASLERLLSLCRQREEAAHIAEVDAARRYAAFQESGPRLVKRRKPRQLGTARGEARGVGLAGGVATEPAAPAAGDSGVTTLPAA